MLTSIRLPKRVVFRGDDEREYPFLVKSGEDLRMDQRIEHVFSMMNEILSEDVSCRDKALTTYAVVPMNTRYACVHR